MRRWAPEELLQVERVRHDWLMSSRLGISPHFEEVGIGDRLPRRALGPHTHRDFRHRISRFSLQHLGQLPVGGAARREGPVDQPGSRLGGRVRF